jgi:EAL domain-containing protein (putative c-di-GMP-specific phosphodiesterase class I)
VRQLRFDRIKLDRSLTQRVLLGSAEQRLVQGAVLMATGLTAAVTAEGIEREEQIELLRLSGCSEMQGYFFSRPLSVAGVTKLLSEAGAVAVA